MCHCGVVGTSGGCAVQQDFASADSMPGLAVAESCPKDQVSTMRETIAFPRQESTLAIDPDQNGVRLDSDKRKILCFRSKGAPSIPLRRQKLNSGTMSRRPTDDSRGIEEVGAAKGPDVSSRIAALRVDGLPVTENLSPECLPRDLRAKVVCAAARLGGVCHWEAQGERIEGRCK